MVNVNVQLPPVVATPFVQPTESLQRENKLQPAIPKAEETHAYTQMRDKEEREQVAHQSSQIIQKESTPEKQHGRSRDVNQRRDYFFASKLKLSHREVDELSVELTGISDFKHVMSVIQERYLASVSPFPTPNVNYEI